MIGNVWVDLTCNIFCCVLIKTTMDLFFDYGMYHPGLIRQVLGPSDSSDPSTSTTTTCGACTSGSGPCMNPVSGQCWPYQIPGSKSCYGGTYPIETPCLDGAGSASCEDHICVCKDGKEYTRGVGCGGTPPPPDPCKGSNCSGDYPCDPLSGKCVCTSSSCINGGGSASCSSGKCVCKDGQAYVNGKGCPAPPPADPHYSCDTLAWACGVDPKGKYTDKLKCQTNCVAPLTTYKCDMSSHTCSLSPTGTYHSKSDCDTACGSPPPTQDYWACAAPGQCVKAASKTAYSTQAVCESSSLCRGGSGPSCGSCAFGAGNCQDAVGACFGYMNSCPSGTTACQPIPDTYDWACANPETSVCTQTAAPGTGFPSHGACTSSPTCQPSKDKWSCYDHATGTCHQDVHTGFDTKALCEASTSCKPFPPVAGTAPYVMYINGSDECSLSVIQAWETAKIAPFTHYFLAFLIGGAGGLSLSDTLGDWQDPTLIKTTILTVMKTAQANGKKVMLSMGGTAMGGPNAGAWNTWASSYANPVAAAADIGSFLENINAKQNFSIDGIDFDYESPGTVIEADLDMLSNVTLALRTVLDARKQGSVITHAPQPPYMCVDDNGCDESALYDKNKCFTDKKDCAGSGYWYINEKAGSAIDFYFVQYYNNPNWDGRVGNIAVGAANTVNHILGMVKGQRGFTGIPIEKIVVGKPGCEACGCGGVTIGGCRCLMSATDIINLILLPVKAALKSQKVPGVGFWDWWHIQTATGDARVTYKGMFDLGKLLNTIPPTANPPAEPSCPGNLDTNCLTSAYGQPKVLCNTHGDCVGDACMCKDGYFTKSSPCDSHNSKVPVGTNGFTCSGNGLPTWGTWDTCACNCGWKGDACDIPDPQPQCPGGNASPCNNHGLCTDSLKCTCDSGWQGPECNIVVPKECIGYNCSHGTCSATDSNPVCTCSDNWEKDAGGKCTKYKEGPWEGWMTTTQFGGEDTWPSAKGLSLDKKKINSVKDLRFGAAVPWGIYAQQYPDRSTMLQTIINSAKGTTDDEACYLVQPINKWPDQVTSNDPKFSKVCTGDNCVDINDDSLAAKNAAGHVYDPVLVVPYEGCGGDCSLGTPDCFNGCPDYNDFVPDFNAAGTNTNPGCQGFTVQYNDGSWKWDDAVNKTYVEGVPGVNNPETGLPYGPNNVIGAGSETDYGRNSNSVAITQPTKHVNWCTTHNLNLDMATDAEVLPWNAAGGTEIHVGDPAGLGPGPNIVARYKRVPCSIHGAIDVQVTN